MASVAGLLPVAVFLAVALVVAVYARRQAAREVAGAGSGGFISEYFLGNRTLGPFVLAMTTIATYGSVSSFVLAHAPCPVLLCKGMPDDWEEEDDFLGNE